MFITYLLQLVETALRQSWSHETSYCPDVWLESNPALGQCAVTALVVQDYLGGEIVWSRVNGISHYFNRIDENEIDLTRSQFSEWVVIPAGISKSGEFNTTRAYILSDPKTKGRYEVLKLRVEHASLNDY